VEKGAIDWVWDYAGNIDAYANHGLGLILHGTNGSGKSLVATLLLKGLLGRGYDGYFTTFQDLLTRFTQGWRDPVEQRWFHRRIKNAGILVVDDLGKEGMKGTDTPMATFDEVIRHRVAASRVSIITSNYSIEDLQKHYGGSVMSLLRGSAIEYAFTGADYRPQYRQQVEDDAKAGLMRPVVLGEPCRRSAKRS
jgi:DNA replication protein DnaC